MKKSTKKTTTTKTPVEVITAATKPAAVAKPAPAPVVVAPLPAKSPIVTSTVPITIEAKVDVGFGNNLFLRGQGEGLSWERGIPLENVDSQTWRLIVPAKKEVQFKLLINDAVWSKGEDLIAAPGNKVEVTPAF